MIKTDKVSVSSEQTNEVQYSQNKRKRTELEVYQQNLHNTKKVCKTSVFTCFVTLAKNNSLVQIEDVVDKAMAAVYYKSSYLKFVKTKEN